MVWPAYWTGYVRYEGTDQAERTECSPYWEEGDGQDEGESEKDGEEEEHLKTKNIHFKAMFNRLR